MATIGQTLFRFAGALLLGASATAIDHPQIVDALQASRRMTAAPEVVAPGLTGWGQVTIAPGKRAYAIRVNDVGNLGGMLHPNSRVDIMVLIDDRNAGRRVAKLFMTNMRLLAIGADRGAFGLPTNTAVASIEVTPDEARVLAIAAAQGTLQLVVRGSADFDSSSTPGAVATSSLAVPLDQCAGSVNRRVIPDLVARRCPPTAPPEVVAPPVPAPAPQRR